MRTSTFLVIFFLMFFSMVSTAEEIKQELISRISPVYEEMLGYQIKSMWRDLSKQRPELKHRKPELVALDKQGENLVQSISNVGAGPRARPNHSGSPTETFGDDVISDLSRESACILLLTQSDPASLAKAAAYIGSSNAIQALLLTEEPVDSLISQIQNAGLAVVSVMSAFELEYVKGEDGRQIVQLDDPAYHQKIFERLVREGMNPVDAHPIVDQAVQDFRKLDRLKLVILACHSRAGGNP